MTTPADRDPAPAASRPLAVYSLVSLDGVAQEPGDWMFDVDDEVFAFLGRVIAEQDDVLLGRGTYDYWVDHWPTSDVEPFASFINGTPKHVVSSRPLTGSWANTVRVESSVADHVADLKQRPGRTIGVHGSITLVRTLFGMGLVDQLHLLIAPAIAGTGARLLPDLPGVVRLGCTYHSMTPSGHLLASYDVLP